MFARISFYKCTYYSRTKIIRQKNFIAQIKSVLSLLTLLYRYFFAKEIYLQFRLPTIGLKKF